MRVLSGRSDCAVGSGAEAPRYGNSRNWRRPVLRAPRPWRASVWRSEPYLVLDLGRVYRPLPGMRLDRPSIGDGRRGPDLVRRSSLQAGPRVSAPSSTSG
jgi:hypothetical protein